MHMVGQCMVTSTPQPPTFSLLSLARPAGISPTYCCLSLPSQPQRDLEAAVPLQLLLCFQFLCDLLQPRGCRLLAQQVNTFASSLWLPTSILFCSRLKARTTSFRTGLSHFHEFYVFLQQGQDAVSLVCQAVCLRQGACVSLCSLCFSHYLQ